MLAISVFAALLMGASGQQGTAAPSATASPMADIPEIGRTRAVTSPCVLLQELVAPSFAAAMHGDKQFAEASATFADYAVARVDATTLPTKVIKADGKQMATRLSTPDQETAKPESLLARLDIEFAGMQKDAARISAALADPRLSPDITDAAVQSERQGLEKVYEIDLARLSAMNMFLQKENLRLSKQRLAEDDCHAAGGDCDVNAPPIAAPSATAPRYDQPMLTFNAANDKRSMTGWTSAMASEVRNVENDAARAFLAVAENCRRSP